MTTLVPTITSAGAVAPTATQIRATLLGNVAATNPDYTAQLPGSLIDDISSTDVAAIAQIMQAAVDAVNSLIPPSANVALLAQLGQMFGLSQGLPANASVSVTFSGTAGFVIPAGFQVSDGTNTYMTQSQVAVPVSGASQPTVAVATNSGQFAIPAASVTQIVSSVPSTVTLTVTNPNAGVPSTQAESVSSYRSRVLQAFSASASSAPATILQYVSQVPGVVQTQFRVIPATNGMEVIVGGGDETAVASAIFASVADPTTLQGSGLGIVAMTAADPVVVTTNYASGFAAGSTFTVAGATPSAYNLTYTVASVSGTDITTTTNGSAFGAYASGATMTPNPRNVIVSLIDGADTYPITYVAPTPHACTMTIGWSTNAPNFAGGASVSTAVAQAISAYVNALTVGSALNTLALTQVFQDAAAPLTAADITSITYSITIDDMTQDNINGVVAIADPEGYFVVPTGGVVVTQNT